MSGASRASRLLAVPDRDHDVGILDEELANQHISRLTVIALARKGHDLVGSLERLLEAVEFLAGREVLAIVLRLEGKQRADEIAARARADRGDLVGTARQRGVKKKLRLSVAAERILGFLELQGRFAKLAEDRVDGGPQVADDGCGQRSRTMSGNANIQDDGPWCGALGQR